jgi:hypothetical protein
MGKKVVDNAAPWITLRVTHRAWTTLLRVAHINHNYYGYYFLTNQKQIFRGGDSMRV